jgi:hypothetical protein
MSKLEPILNSSLSPAFRTVHLSLAREPDHPAGDENVGYVLVMPLKPDGKIDQALWRNHKEACRVTRLRPGEPDAHGHLVRRPGGTWVFRYEAAPEEAGYHFQDERFVEGEYVSVREEGEAHPFRVVRVERL